MRSFRHFYISQELFFFLNQDFYEGGSTKQGQTFAGTNIFGSKKCGGSKFVGVPERNVILTHISLVDNCQSKYVLTENVTEASRSTKNKRHTIWMLLPREALCQQSIPALNDEGLLASAISHIPGSYNR